MEEQHITYHHIFFKPRYLQLLDYPFQNNSKGAILMPFEHERLHIENFPEVFKKLKWWELRTIEEITTNLKFIEVTEESKCYWLVGDKLKVIGFEYDLTNSLKPKITFVRATGFPTATAEGNLFDLKKILPATEFNIKK